MNNKLLGRQSGLLTASDEVRLSRLIHAGTEAEGRLQAGAVCEDDRSTAARGRRARRRFLEANVGLVYSMARTFGRPRHVALDDVIQDGMLGLHKAVDRFDPDAGFRFSTYATWWIRQTMQKGLETTAGPIRIPHGVRISALSEPRTDGTEIGTLESLARNASRVQSIQALTESSHAPPVVATDDPSAQAVDSVVLDLIHHELDRLDAQTRRYVVRWFGIGGVPAESLRVIAATEGVSATAVRKRIERGLDHIRSSCNLPVAA